jgi:hypothetical protein
VDEGGKLPADLPAQGKGPEHEADQLRAALGQVRAGTSRDDGTKDVAPQLADRAAQAKQTGPTRTVLLCPIRRGAAVTSV